jgi:hypothetical protein
MNRTARLPSQARPTGFATLLPNLQAAVRDTAAFIFIREAYTFFAPPPALRYSPSQRAQRFMRSGE